jgi:uncharacterized protein (DUF4415 family)
LLVVAYTWRGEDEIRVFRRELRSRTNDMPTKKGNEMKKEYDFSEAKRGTVVDPAGKTRITIWLDDDVLDAFRARANADGRGYQTLINEALKNALVPDAAPVTVGVLRRILHEELRVA